MINDKGIVVIFSTQYIVITKNTLLIYLKLVANKFIN